MNRSIRTRRRYRLGVAPRLLLSYVAIIGAGILTFFLVANAIAPQFFAGHLAEMAGLFLDAHTLAQMEPTEARRHAEQLDAALRANFRVSMVQALLAASAAAILAAVPASLFVTSRIVAPIRRQLAASRRIASGHYAERVPPGAGDELGDLAASFNEMASSLEATERRRLQLIGDVAHELKTPIATLSGYAEGLLDGVIKPTPQTWARLHGEAQRLARLVDDLQELWRAESREVPLDLHTVHVARLVKTALGSLESLFAEKGVALTVDALDELPLVSADEGRAVQVLTNLLMNALRFTPPHGTVRVTGRRVPAGVEIVVTDTGSGIAPEHLPHLFERFYRADRSRSRALGGSGIGLAISRALVEAMGGQIWASSEGPGCGATFGFTLPAEGRAESASD